MNEWISRECPGPPTDQPRHAQLALGTRSGHASHELAFYEPCWICIKCGCRALEGRGHLRGLSEVCSPPTKMGSWVMSRAFQGRPPK
eukprot:5059698-Pyramimonas_sp.AAC.1